MITWKTGMGLAALIAMSVQANAAEVCDQGSASALKTAAVQQELMVAGFACNASSDYNRFVLANRTELQLSDAALMNYFRSRDGNEAGYDSYKTKLANLAAGRSAADGTRYCRQTAHDFAAADGRALKDFIAGEHLLIAAPEACAVKYDQPDVAVAGPSYAMPASPYGAPARVAEIARRPAAPAVRYRANDRDGDKSYSYYGPPPGWLPPRPAPRWSRYGYGPYGGYYED